MPCSTRVRHEEWVLHRDSRISSNGASARSFVRPSWRAWVISAQLPGRTGLQKSTRPSVSVRTTDVTAFCLVLPEMNLTRSLRRRSAVGGRAAHADLGAADDSGLSVGAQVLDDQRRATGPRHRLWSRSGSDDGPSTSASASPSSPGSWATAGAPGPSTRSTGRARRRPDRVPDPRGGEGRPRGGQAGRVIFGHLFTRYPDMLPASTSR